MPVMPTLRPVAPADARPIAEIHVRAWRTGYQGIVGDHVLGRLSVDARERRWAEVLAGEGRPYSTLVAVGEGGEIEGVCTTAAPSRDDDADPRTAEVAATYVDPARWRSGAGTALMRAALAELREGGYRIATLWVLERNDQARSFYRWFGFEPDGATGEAAGASEPTVRLRARLDGLLLRPLARGDEGRLLRILERPEVARWWDRPEPGFPWTDIDPDTRRLAVELDGELAGMVQFSEEPDPKYRHASIDLFLDPARHGRGIGTEVVGRVVRHLLFDRGHHRITIDPATSNHAAIRAYEKAGFRRVGVMRRHERDAGGEGWHDGLLMELVADEAA